MTGSHASVAERLERLSIPEPNSGCVLWLGAISNKGYGRIHVRGKARHAHIVAYETYVGPIPEGMDLDHLCRNHACRAEWHLEPVTRRVNLLRGDTHAARNAAKTACPQGHPYDESNTRIYSGRRNCQACMRERSRRRRAIRAAMAAEQAPALERVS